MKAILDERGFPDETIDVLFAEPPLSLFERAEQHARACHLNGDLRAVAKSLRDAVATSADRTDAMRKLREIRALAIDAIRLEEHRR